MENSAFVSVAGIQTLRTPKSYEWAPFEDITTYELALATPILALACGVPYAFDYEAAIAKLPEAARRHFKLIG